MHRKNCCRYRTAEQEGRPGGFVKLGSNGARAIEMCLGAHRQFSARWIAAPSRSSSQARGQWREVTVFFFIPHSLLEEVVVADGSDQVQGDEDLVFPLFVKFLHYRT